MEIRHLALTVREPERSLAFYRDTIGVVAAARTEPWGVRVSTGDGFVLALIRGEPVPAEAVARVHFGCTVPSPGAVRDARERLRASGVAEVEWCEEEGYVSVKVSDPDGYVVELSYDVQ